MQERALHMSVFVNIFRFHMWLYLYNCLQHMYNRLSVALFSHAHLTELIKVWMTDGKWEITGLPESRISHPSKYKARKTQYRSVSRCDPSVHKKQGAYYQHKMAIPFEPNPRKPNAGSFRKTKLAECRAELPNATRLLVHISSGVRRSLKSTLSSPHYSASFCLSFAFQ